MTNFVALVRRELGVYFVSPLAYIMLMTLLLITGLVFHFFTVQGAVAARAPGNYGATMSAICLVVIFSSALVTMRLIAEEKGKGTLEILLTAPVTETQVVLAKFGASLALLVFLLLPTTGFAVILARYGSVDLGQVLCGYLGVLILAGALYAIGIFISSLCASQITAGVLTFAVIILFLIANVGTMFLPESSIWRQFLDFVNFGSNLGDFVKGVVDTSRLVYLLSFSAFFLFLTTRILETRRWR